MTFLETDTEDLVTLARSAPSLAEWRTYLGARSERGASKLELRRLLRVARSELERTGEDIARDAVLDGLDIVEGWISSHLRLANLAVDEGLYLSPIDPEFVAVYEQLVRPAVEALGIEMTPVEELDAEGAMHALVRRLLDSKVLVADLTGSDPWVMYALGAAHALNTPSVIVAQDLDDVPSDLRAYSPVIYSTRFDLAHRLSEDLTKALRDVLDLAHRSSPLADIRALPRLEVKSERPATHEEPPGIFDLAEEVQQRATAVNASTVEIGRRTEALGSALNVLTAEIEAVQRKLSHQGAFARRRQIVKVAAAHLDEYADALDAALVEQRSQWPLIAEATIGFVTLAVVESEADRNALGELLGELASLEGHIGPAVDSIDGMRGSIETLYELRLSKEFSRSARRVFSGLAELSEALRSGIAHLSRIRAAITSRLGD